MAEGLAKALAEITTATANVNDLAVLYNTKEMKKFVAIFYAQILSFCLKAISWYELKGRCE
jgi:hypothetical protein